MTMNVVANSEGSSSSKNNIVGRPSSVHPFVSVVHDYHFVDIHS